MNELAKPTVLFTEQQIQERVRGLGQEITRDFTGGQIAVVGIIPNAMVFMADLIRHIELPTICDFLNVISSSEGKRIDIAFGTETHLSSRDLLLLQGVVDTGVTMSFIAEHILEDWKPRSLKVAALIDREVHRKVDCPVDYACFKLDKEGFVVGYGLAHREYYRGTRYLGLIEKERRI
jgi:hypoxanthine phosphoribosyltransferase